MIVHINSNYATNIIYKNLLQELIALNPNNMHSVIAAVRKEGEINQNNIAHPNCEVYYKNIIKKYHKLLYHQKIKSIERFSLKKIDPKEVKLIQATFQYTDGGVAYELFKKYDIPYTIGIKNTDINYFYKYLFYLRSYGYKIVANASAIIFPSNSYLNKYTSYNLPDDVRSNIEKNAHVIPNGIDQFWHQNKGVSKSISKDEINLLYVGEINANKNITTTLKVVDLLVQKKYKVNFDVIGAPRNQQSQKIINQLRQHPHVSYHGPIKDKEKLKKFYRNATVFIMPSFKESFGLVYAEAMSQATPVIYTKNEGFDNQFKDGEVGFSCQPDNPKEIANLVEKIMDQYSVLSQNCISNVSRFQWKSIAQKYNDLNEAIIQKNL